MASYLGARVEYKKTMEFMKAFLGACSRVKIIIIIISV